MNSKCKVWALLASYEQLQPKYDSSIKHLMYIVKLCQNVFTNVVFKAKGVFIPIVESQTFKILFLKRLYKIETLKTH
jgi:hypothetical protein